MAVAEICKEIRKLAEKDSRSAQQIYASTMQLGAMMAFSKQWPRDKVLDFCAGIVKFLDLQTPEEKANEQRTN